MKRRLLKISAFCLAVILIAGVCWFANGLVGNPISRMLARNAAEAYLAEKYSGTDYTIEKISYDFKDVGYYARIVSPSSTDGNFTLRISMLGKIKYDDFEHRVLGHENVANRLNVEYSDRINAVLQNSAFPYAVSIGYGNLEFEQAVGEAETEGAIRKSELVNDGFYNVSALGATNGKLVLYVDSDTVTKEKAAEILLTTKELLDQSGISFYSIHLVLQYPPYDSGQSYARPAGEIRLGNFRSCDIYEDGIMDRIAKCIEDTQNYYEEQEKA